MLRVRPSSPRLVAMLCCPTSEGLDMVSFARLLDDELWSQILSVRVSELLCAWGPAKLSQRMYAGIVLGLGWLQA